VARTDTLTRRRPAGRFPPDKGADGYSIVDSASGIDVLFKTPWGLREQVSVVGSGDSQQEWLARHPVGWQHLVPNSGAAGKRAARSSIGMHADLLQRSGSVATASRHCQRRLFIQRLAPICCRDPIGAGVVARPIAKVS
jgi:hypothetical protein